MQQVNVAQGAQAIVGNVTLRHRHRHKTIGRILNRCLPIYRVGMPIIDNSGRKEKEEVSLRRKT